MRTSASGADKVLASDGVESRSFVSTSSRSALQRSVCGLQSSAKRAAGPVRRLPSGEPFPAGSVHSSVGNKLLRSCNCDRGERGPVLRRFSMESCRGMDHFSNDFVAKREEADDKVKVGKKKICTSFIRSSNKNK